MVNVGDYVVIRNLRTLINLAKTLNEKRYVSDVLHQLTEPDNFMLATVVKTSSRKWKLDELMTEDDSYYLGNDNITFTADWYDIKALNAAVEVTEENELMGKFTEKRVKGDY